MSEECLQGELDFYQLPSAASLGIELLPLIKCTPPVQPPMVELFYEILAEIKTCNFTDHACLTAFVYYKHVEDRVEGGRRVMILPPVGYKLIQYVTDRGHDAFDRAIFQGSNCSTMSYNGGRIITPPNSAEQYRIVSFKDAVRLELLNKEAEKFGMIFESTAMEFGPDGKKLALDLLKLKYKS